MSTARQRILGRIRRALAAVPAPPPLPAPMTTAGEEPLGWDGFREAVEEAGAVFHRGPVALPDLAAFVDRRTDGAAAPCAAGAAALLGRREGPRNADALDGTPWFVISAPRAIARCGAVVVTERDVAVRLQALLPERLIVLVPESGLVQDLPDVHADWPRDGLAGGWRTLLCGPSKTADIEQTLVQGAHGPRHLEVVVHLGPAGP